MKSTNRRSRFCVPALLAVAIAAGSAGGATGLGQVAPGAGNGGGGLFGPGPTTGWLTAVGLVSVGVAGALRRRHRAVT
jgi:hypothetical protein